MPARSTGCATCRKRKVRCDETRPGCKRCATHGVPCPGYRQDIQSSNQFMDETQEIILKAKKSYGVKVTDLGYQTESSSPETTIDCRNVTPPLSVASADSNGELALFSFNNTFPLQISSPDIERLQLFNKFIDIYLPENAPWNVADHSNFFQVLALTTPENRALRYGMDALSLVQVGSVKKDDRLIKRGVSSYGQALGYLAKAIEKGDHVHDDQVLLAVTLLTTCELYSDIASMGGWLSHAEGTERLVVARGPDGMLSDMAILIYSNLRHSVLIKAVLTRREPFLAAPEWRALGWKLPSYLQDGSTVFYDSAVQVPGILQRFDRLDLTSPTALVDVMALMERATELEMELREWYDMEQTLAKSNNRVYLELRPLDDFVGFTSLCKDRTFGEAFMFADFYLGFLYTFYWMLLYYLRSTVKELQRHRHQLDAHWFPDAEETVEDDEVLEYVLNVCRCIPFFCEKRTGSAGSIVMFLPMRVTSLYFVYHGHWKYLKWVSAMRNSVFVKGLTPPEITSSTYSPAMQPVPADVVREGISTAYAQNSGFNQT